MNSVLTLEEIFSELRDAFPLQPVPYNVGVSANSEKINGYFNFREWDKVTIDGLLNESGLGADHGLTWMNANGYRYYLPAYILLSLSMREDSYVWLLEPFFTGLCAYEILSTFIAEDNPKIDPARTELFDSFNPRQKQVVADFLEYFSTADPHIGGAASLRYLAEMALKSYWRQFLHRHEK